MAKSKYFNKLFYFSLILLVSFSTPSFGVFKSRNYEDCVAQCNRNTSIQKQCVGSVRNAGLSTAKLIEGYCLRKHGSMLNKGSAFKGTLM